MQKFMNLEQPGAQETHQNLIPHRLPIPVTITALKVRAEDEVVVGQELLELERWEEKGETHG